MPRRDAADRRVLQTMTSAAITGRSPDEHGVGQATDLDWLPDRGRALRRGSIMLRAVDRLSLSIAPGEVLARGRVRQWKDHSGRAILRLLEPTADHTVEGPTSRILTSRRFARCDGACR
jgi:hypothetical protein